MFESDVIKGILKLNKTAKVFVYGKLGNGGEIGAICCFKLKEQRLFSDVNCSLLQSVPTRWKSIHIDYPALGQETHNSSFSTIFWLLGWIMSDVHVKTLPQI